MQINGKGRIDPSALSSIKPVGTERQTPTTRQNAIAPAVERPKQDTVSFSDEARALADGSSPRVAASTDRLADVKQRVLMGAYNTAEMAGEVARRILQRGDL
jgi:anti-sigma28 factor (negative regulator of flagellin synthesis)